MPTRLACLPHPKPNSHKGENGTVLILGGSETYHGAPVLCAIAASRFCDLVYFSSTPENNAVARRMKTATPNVVVLPGNRLDFAIRRADCVLVGSGMDDDAVTRRAVERILRAGKKCVLDAAAIRVAPLGLLHGKAIATPHAGEFAAAFGMKASKEAAMNASKKYGCAILLKGKEDIVAFRGKAAEIPGGNAGMTKGGTGDVLAGLCAALYAKCGSPFSAACTASLVNKKAGEMLFHSVGFNFSSLDLANELPFAAACLGNGKKSHE